MTIRFRQPDARTISTKRITALLTRSLLSPTSDDSPEVHSVRAGTGWMRWSDSQGLGAAQAN